MIINRDHRRWALGTTFAAGAMAALFAVHVAHSPTGMSGGSWTGLFFGVVATVLMVVAGLLAARKKVRTLRVGSAQAWLKAHLWCGLLAMFAVWFHSGFAFGGTLTTAIMVLFYIVIVSGLVGVVLQHFVPAKLTTEVPLETVHGQIDAVCAGLAVDAYENVAAVTGPLEQADVEKAAIDAEAQLAADPKRSWKLAPRTPPAGTPKPGADKLRSTYLEQVRPYLRGKSDTAPQTELAALARTAPEEWRTRVVRLAEICDEVRQLRRQRQLQRWLHVWLYAHAPLSFGLFVLVAFHIAYALRYAWVELP